MKKDDCNSEAAKVSRREFLKISSIAASVPLVTGPSILKIGGQDVELHGPGKAAMSFNVNGKKLTAVLEPRVTLLDALREQFQITGPKRVCDHGACGACTVLLSDEPVYACSVLAVEAQNKSIITTEGLAPGNELHPVSQAFVENDAQQCGFCTPGFVMATKAFLDKNPSATLAEVAHGLGGNFCRCGTYDGIKRVATRGNAKQA